MALDLEAIGKRISEQRKHFKRVTQGKMAIDLRMEQATISNLEHAKSGSGITDLTKLEMIADYFDIPLQTLLFGGCETMEKYQGTKMRLEKSSKRLSDREDRIIRQVIGIDLTGELNMQIYENSFYRVCIVERIDSLGEYDAPEDRIINALRHLFCLVFSNNELVGTCGVAVTKVDNFLQDEKVLCLEKLIPNFVLNQWEIQRVLNPYHRMWTYETDEVEKQKYVAADQARMEQLKHEAGETFILQVESAYVREDARNHGILRMCMDVLLLMYPDCAIWLNLEPTILDDLEKPQADYPGFGGSLPGAVHLNAAIAERLGFVVDGYQVKRRVERKSKNGEPEMGIAVYAKVAYSLPDTLRNILLEDDSVLEFSRLLESVNNNIESTQEVRSFDGIKDDCYIFEMVASSEDGSLICYYAAYDLKKRVYRYGVSNRRALLYGIYHEGQLEVYEHIDETVNSENDRIFYVLHKDLQVRCCVVAALQYSPYISPKTIEILFFTGEVWNFRNGYSHAFADDSWSVQSLMSYFDKKYNTAVEEMYPQIEQFVKELKAETDMIPESVLYMRIRERFFGEFWNAFIPQFSEQAQLELGQDLNYGKAVYRGDEVWPELERKKGALLKGYRFYHADQLGDGEISIFWHISDETCVLALLVSEEETTLEFHDTDDIPELLELMERFATSGIYEQGGTIEEINE